MPSQRKRFSAFEDFPSEPEPGSTPPPAPEKKVGETRPVEPQVERIERLKPSQMMPDRFQPRRLLPSTLRPQFFSGKINCYQAAAEWMAMARNDSGIHVELDQLLAMGTSFEEHGQIKPITGAWEAQADGNYIFRIETGERRFWASCLQAVLRGVEEEPLLRVEVISHPTRQRQVLENRHAEPPSAVGQSCEVASLILSELGVQPEVGLGDEFDYFRLARAQRMPAGLWERIMPVMQLTRPRMVQLLNILQFPTPQLELADRFRVSERVLREILTLPRAQWEEALRLSIHNNLTAEEVADAVQPAPETKARSTEPAALPQPARVAAGGLRRFARVIGEMDEFGQSQALEEIADTLVATRQAQGIRLLLDELSRLIDIRLSRL